MPSTDAQKRARQKYQENKTKLLTVRFSPVDMDLYEYVVSKGNMAGYIKSLIRKDMGE